VSAGTVAPVRLRFPLVDPTGVLAPVLAAIVVTAVVGVGSTAGGVGAAGAAGSDPRLTRAGLIARADAVCAKGYAAAERLRASSHPTARGKAAARQIDATLVVLDRQIAAFADLRGPRDTDRLLARTVSALRTASSGLRDLRSATIRDGSSVDGAVAAHPALVRRINAASTTAADDLVRLGFLGCVAAQGDPQTTTP